MISMVSEGLGVTIMPELALPASRDGVAIVPLRPTLRRTLHLLSKSPETLAPAARAFVTLALMP